MSRTVAPGMSLRGLLKRVSHHLDSMASEIHGIEHTIGEELVSISTQRMESITRLQRLDFLRQSMEDLALLTLFLSNNHDGSIDIGLAEKLRLETTKQLVLGNADPLALPSSQNSLGEVDLF